MDFYSQYIIYTWIQAAWILASAYFFLKRRDEIPLVISGFLYYVFSFRLWALLNGLSSPIDISPFGFAPISLEQGLKALAIVALGETALIGTYMSVQRQKLDIEAITLSPVMLRWIWPFTFVFAAIAIPAALAARWLTGVKVDEGKVMAFEVSAYLYELPLMLISVAILFALLWKCGGLKNRFQRFVGFLVFCIVAMLTFGPTGRFQFLGWVLAVTIIASAGDKVGRRVTKISLGFATALILFGVAGALRSSDEDANLQRDAWERLFFAEDANMLDGLALLEQVYPDRLPFSYGGEHLEILERPIPRAIWPDKPVGGYMNKLGLNDIATGFTIGISPSLLGSFYQEGGMIGVVILSVIYGFCWGKLISYSTQIKPFAGAMIRGIGCASVIPLLRGGDLPGVYAWIFMAFWPCFFVLWVWRREFFVSKKIATGWRRFSGVKRSPANNPALLPRA